MKHTIGDEEVPPEQFWKVAERRQLIEQYNDMARAYKLSGNGLLLWLCLEHCIEHKLAIPESLITTLAALGRKAILAAQKKGVRPSDYAKALQLKSGTQNLTAWEQADRWRHKVNLLGWVHHWVNHGLTPKNACELMARDDPRVQASTLVKDYSRHIKKTDATLDPIKNPDYNAFTTWKSALPKKRKRR